MRLSGSSKLDNREDLRLVTADYLFLWCDCRDSWMDSSTKIHWSFIYVYRLPIEISFTATEQKEVNFNVLCHVKKKTSPLTLNVKAEGYAMNAQLICEDSQGNKVELTSKGINRINLGMVRITDKITGRFGFCYNLLRLMKIVKVVLDVIGISDVTYCY